MHKASIFFSLWQVVAKVLAKLGREADGEENTVHRIIMNPKAMTINQMYGFFDELNEWNDGILATTYRLCNTFTHFSIIDSCIGGRSHRSIHRWQTGISIIDSCID